MFRKRKGAVGIGTLIVFIAMVLVAAVAAAVLINTSGFLQQKASSTGRETTQEVASGIKVEKVVGYVPGDKPASGKITKLAIYVSPNAGSAGIDMKKVRVILSNGDKQAIFSYNATGDGKITIAQDSSLSTYINVTNGQTQLTFTYNAGSDKIGNGDTLQIANGTANIQVTTSGGTTDSTKDLDGDGSNDFVYTGTVTIYTNDGALLKVGNSYLALRKGANVLHITAIDFSNSTDTNPDGSDLDYVKIESDDGQYVEIGTYHDDGSNGDKTSLSTSAATANVYDVAFTKFDDLTGGIFNGTNAAWGAIDTKTGFGIIALQDSDNSLKKETPTLTKGDLAVITIYVGGQFAGTNNGAVFGEGFAPRTKITGKVVPEFGAPGVIEFTTPTSFTSNIIELQ